MMRKILKHPVAVVIVCLALTVFLALQLRGISLDNSTRLYFPQKHESYKRLLETEDIFGSMSIMGVAISTEQGSILTPDNIKTIDRLTQRCLEVEHVSNIDSITHIDYLYGLDGALATSNLIDMDSFGYDEQLDLQMINTLRTRLSEWEDMYDKVIISDDGKATLMQITLDVNLTPKETDTVLYAIRKIVAEEVTDPAITARIVGDATQSDLSRTFILSDLTRLIPIVVIVVLLTLFFSFKTIDGMILPLITVLISTVWSVGFMALFNVNFTIVASIIPVALIACGSAYGIHVLNHYYLAIDSVPLTIIKNVPKDVAQQFEGLDAIEENEWAISKEKHMELIISSIAEVKIAVLLAGITTIVGFASLITSPLVPLHSFAIFASLGIAFSLILSVTLLPSLLMLKKPCSITKKINIKFNTHKYLHKKIKSIVATTPESQSTMYSIYHFFAGTTPRVILLVIAIALLSWFGLRKLVIETAMINYFPPTSTLRQDVDYIDSHFAGTNSLFFVVSGEKKGDLTNPEILKATDNLQEYLETNYPNEIGKVVSFTTFIKRMNQIMHIPLDESENNSDDSYSSSDNYDSFSSFGDSSFGFSSFGDSSFSDDSFGSFGDYTSSFGRFDSYDNADDFDTSFDFVDPNIEYSQHLSKDITFQDMLAMLNKAYALAGGKNASIEDVILTLGKQMNYNGLAYYEVPYDVSKYPVANREALSDLVSQYLLLYSGSLDRFADDQLAPQSVRMTVQLTTHSSVAVNKIVNDINNYSAKYFPEGYTLEATGNAEMESVMTDLIIRSQILSLIFSLLFVFVIISISFKSPVAGIIGAIPLALTILMNYMIMGFTGIKLDLVTSIIASVAVGVGIDYTIHFMTAYNAERKKTDDLVEVTRNAIRVSGRGILTNAFAVGLGFLVLCFSEFLVIRYIGILAAVVMFSSSMLAIVLLPGILNIFDPKFMQK